MVSHSGQVHKYGLKFPAGTSDLTIELYCWRHGRTVEKGGLGKAEHFWKIVDLIWNRPDSPKNFHRIKWAEKMVQAYCDYRYLGVAGCASSGKTDTFAVISIVEFLSAPTETMVLVTSTSLKDSRKRIWGSIVEYWNASGKENELDEFGKPALGKLVDSVGLIRGPISDRTGISLVAADDSKAKGAVKKLIGFKKDRVILIADELPELSHAILDAAFGNLSANDEFRLAGLGNPDSYYDPFGKLCEPKGGWQEGGITPDDTEWEGKMAHVIRFDGHLSENYITREKVIPWMRSYEDIIELQEQLGENSAEYWRMVRGFWSPTGKESCVYEPSDFIKSRAHRQIVWKSQPLPVAALDPAFTSGGDSPTAVFALLGEEMPHSGSPGGPVLMFMEYEKLDIDITNKTDPPSYQVSEKFRAFCEKHKVQPREASVDATGSGISFCDILSAVWSPDFNRVVFAGKATSKPVSHIDKTPGFERYTNRVSELWFAGKPMLAASMLAGMHPDLVNQMTARIYHTTKGSSGLKMTVEPKHALTKRLGNSPDLADAFFVLLDHVRERHGFGIGSGRAIRGGKRDAVGARSGPPVPGKNNRTNNWGKLAAKYAGGVAQRKL